jgi:hypothetical protein
MYKPGLGDCFLLSFPTSAGKEFHILIDCGALSSADNVLTDVVNDIRQRTSGSIDVVIATHEHWDHISGFSQAKKIFDKIKVRSVWTSWTEEPGNDAAAILRERFKKKKAAVDKAVGMMPSKIQDKQLGMYKEKITEVLQFSGGLGVSKANKTATAWKNYLGLSKKKKYCSPKRAPIEIDDVNDVRVFVLGPPENPDYIKKKLSKVETYDDGGHAFAAFSGFAAAFAGNSGDGGEEQEDQRSSCAPQDGKEEPLLHSELRIQSEGYRPMAPHRR